MSGLHERVRALLLSVSRISLASGALLVAHTQLAQAQSAPQTGYGQIGAPTQQPLDAITVAASKMEERAIDALAPVSVVTLEEIQGRQASTVGDLIYNLPGVWLQNRGDEPSTSINIRGMQDFGRVAVVVDGARQNYQRTGHFANGSFFLNPELISGIDIVRGPTANIYGSGAIGGVASFRTKDVDDVVRAGERWGVDINSVIGSNQGRAMGSMFAGARVNPNVDIFAGGTYSTQDDYRDGTNYQVANTWNRLSSGIAKITVRPADGHEIKLGTIFQENIYNVGQPKRSPGDPNALPLGPPAYPGGPPSDPNGPTSIYATNVKNYTTTLGWKYSQPDDKLFDWDAKVYWNRTENDQVKIGHTTSTNSAYCGGGAPGNPISGCIGDNRSYLIDTYGIDLHNTSRFETDNWRHALTYGVDGFRDNVNTQDSRGNSNVTTPGGVRTVSGGFVQWKANYTSLFELVSAVRYDNYHLDSGATSVRGDRFSPKITLGLLPTSVVTPYVSYAEGYRAPSVTETLIDGSHVGATTNDSFFTCPSGQRLPTIPNPPGQPINPNTSTFCFVPNSNLLPEIGKTKEIGFNVKKNDLFASGDSFRGKFNVFRNDVEDYIDTVAYGTPYVTGGASYYPFLQYQNINAARIQGFEAETMYDAGSWFVGVSATIQEGKNVQTGIGLYSIPPQKFTTTAGIRFADNKATLSVMWTSVKGNTDVPANYLPGTSYDMVNLYLSMRPTPNVTLTASVENLLDQYYRPYAIPRGSSTDTQNDVKWASAGAGLTFKAGLRYHFGG